jgi:tetraacyldisaccharide 4'-kinase
MSFASDLYARAARARRQSWARPGRQRTLDRPVVSVGNLRVGGTGKTPVVSHVAQLLLDAGERPAVLSRGYARRSPSDDVVVVSDGSRMRADLDRSGDEPLMLARALPGVAVLVCADRHRAGRLAERTLGVTVHILDDGFQHLPLARDVDLVIVTRDDLQDPRTLPSGRLRESLETAAMADAILVPDADDDEAASMATRLGAPRAFTIRRTTGTPRRLDLEAASAPLEAGTPVFAVAGIARPERFFDAAARSGHPVAGTMVFRDHHRFTASDVRDIVSAAGRAGAGAILTTEKDTMRLLAFRPWPLALAWLPLTSVVEPSAAFRDWLIVRVRAARPSAGAPVTTQENG